MRGFFILNESRSAIDVYNIVYSVKIDKENFYLPPLALGINPVRTENISSNNVYLTWGIHCHQIRRWPEVLKRKLESFTEERST